MPSSQRRAILPPRLRHAIRAFDANHQSIAAGHLAFMALLSLFPFLIVLVATAGVLGSTDTAREVVMLGLEQVPDEVGAVLGPVAFEVVNAPRRGVLTIGVIGALWAASSGFEALRYAFDRAYGVTDPPQLWWRRLQSLLLTLVFAAVILVTALAVLVVPRLLEAVAPFVEGGEALRLAFPWLGGATLVLCVVMLTAALFKVLPYRRLGWLEVLPGALFTVAGWAGAVQAFDLYLTNVAAYGLTYGSLGGVVATLMFFYVAAAVLLFGCELNAAGRHSTTERRRA